MKNYFTHYLVTENSIKPLWLKVDGKPYELADGDLSEFAPEQLQWLNAERNAVNVDYNRDRQQIMTASFEEVYTLITAEFVRLGCDRRYHPAPNHLQLKHPFFGRRSLPSVEEVELWQQYNSTQDWVYTISSNYCQGHFLDPFPVLKVLKAIPYESRENRTKIIWKHFSDRKEEIDKSKPPYRMDIAAGHYLSDPSYKKRIKQAIAKLKTAA